MWKILASFLIFKFLQVFILANLLLLEDYFALTFYQNVKIKDEKQKHPDESEAIKSWKSQDEWGRGVSSTTAASCPEKLYSSFSRLNVMAYFGDGQKCGDDDTEDWWGAGGDWLWQGVEVEMVKPDVA